MIYWQTISATGGGVVGETSSIQGFIPPSYDFHAVKHVVESGGQTLTTFSFVCYGATECVITGALKEELESYVMLNESISNGALTITNDGTTMKLINSVQSGSVKQHGTFTFYNPDMSGGGEPGGGDTGGGGVPEV